MTGVKCMNIAIGLMMLVLLAGCGVPLVPLI